MSVNLLLGLIGSILAGAILIVLGFRGKRINDHPICRFCGFDLEGVVPGGITCPECGAGLKRERSVRIGQRRRRPIFLAVGSAAALLPMATIGLVLFATLTGAELNTYKPLGLLLWEARRSNQETAAAAAEEIHARFQRGALEPTQRQTVIDAAISIQRDPGLIWSEKWGDIMTAAHTAGDIDKDQFAEFGAHGALLDYKARPTVAAGADIPIAILLKEARVGSGHMFWGTMNARNITVNGQPARFQLRGASAPTGAGGAMTSGHVGWVQLMGSTGAWGTRSNGGALLTVAQPEGLEPGDAEVKLTIDLNVQDQTAMQAGTTVWETGEDAEGPNFRKLELTFPFRIVPKGAVMARELPADASTTERMMSSIVPGQTWVHDAGWGNQQQVVLTFSIHNPPAPFAYDIVLRDGEREWPAGSISSDEYALDQGWGGASVAGAVSRQANAVVRGLDVYKLDLVLRPSAEVAASTVGLEEYYGGELVFEDFELEQPDTGPSYGGGLLRWLFGG